MKNFSAAFTMIELVFVIVILGILMAVSIPKFAATRGDAMTAKLASNIMTSASEISSYAMSQSMVDSNFTVMSNTISLMQERGEAVLTPNTAAIKAGNIANCITLLVDVNDTTGIDTLRIVTEDAHGDRLCLALQNALGENRYSMKLRGSSINY
jgi:prepilin-type N-terminal cleavage/methylation domain-containing protein